MERVGETIARAAARAGQRNRTPTASAKLSDGTLIEMVYDPGQSSTGFVAWRDDRWKLMTDYELPDGRRLVPFSPHNNLLVHGVVRFPTGPVDYGSDGELVAAVMSFLRRYVGVSPLFERLAAYYVLLSWVYDAFNELPYLRVRGEPGCGKTRFLLTVGSLCYKPIFASGASTISPLFRILDAMQGTLVIDESDFRMSDERAEVVKILNNGNVRGFPVLRTEQVPGTREFNPRAYHVFGPKLVATRGFFDDAALESRFLSEHMEVGRLRDDIPINLPAAHGEEALGLRNRLLLFRFRSRDKARSLTNLMDRGTEPRLSQIFSPLISIVEDEKTRRDLRELAAEYQRELVIDRGTGEEAELLEAARDLWVDRESPPTVRDVTGLVAQRSGNEMLTPKRVGWVLRRKLGLSTVKRHGVYVLAPSERAKLDRLCERFGVTSEQDSDGAEQSPPSPQSPRNEAA